MNRELTKLVSRGCGLSAETMHHPRFGTGIWQYSSKSCNIVIFDQGIAVHRQGTNEKVEIAFAEVIGVHSSLNAIVISEASANNSFDIELPLRLDLHDRQVDLDVPLVIYSALIITIQDMRPS